jgi:large subunit ribosomal protein L25
MAQNSKTLLNVVRREQTGKKVRALRREGIVPANIYGNNVDSVAVQVSSDDLRHLMRGQGRSEIVYVQLDGEERPTFIRDVQRNPVTDQVLHIDFMQISLMEKVKIEVPLHFVGIAPAVDTYGGIVTHQLNQVLVEALPTSIPSAIEVDLSGLTEIGQALHVSNLNVPEGAVILNDAESAVARIDLPAAERAEEVEVGEAGEVPVAEETGAPAPSGEAEE